MNPQASRAVSLSGVLVSGLMAVVITALTPDGQPISDATRLALRDYLDPPAVSADITGVTSNTITVGSTAGFRASGIVHVGSMASERIHTYTGLSGTQFTGVSPAPTFTAGEDVWQTGRGGGRAPVGHHVIIAKGTIFAVDVAATVELLPGYALTTRPDAVNILEAIKTVLRAYIDPLPPGAQVVRQRVEAVIMGVVGVYDITGTTLNGTAGNITAPAQGTPTLDDVTLTEGSVP